MKFNVGDGIKYYCDTSWIYTYIVEIHGNQGHGYWSYSDGSKLAKHLCHSPLDKCIKLTTLEKILYL